MKSGYLCADGKHLNITNKNIEGLLEEPYLPTIEYLDITAIANEVELDYSQFKGLKKLMISSLKPYTFPAEICQLPNLAQITCSGRCLIPPEIGEMKALKTLSVNGDCMVNMPESIVQVKSLESLEVSYYNSHPCPMPRWISRMTQLKQLYTFLCLFTEIDAAINNLENLKVLKIVGSLSAATDFPSLHGLQNLETLQISGEGYPSLPKPAYELFAKVLDGICELHHLKQLCLDGWRSRKKTDYLVVTQQGHSIPDIFEQFQDLVMMDLSGMKLDFLPESLFHLPNLKRINIGGNNLSPECLQQLHAAGIKTVEY